jgi:hypothetical protein
MSTGATTAARLRLASFVTLVVLLVEYGLGVGVNIFVKVPDADAGHGMGQAFGKAMSNGPAGLAAHVGLGILLVVGSLAVVVLAVRSRGVVAIVSSVVAFLALVGAAMSGAQFVDKGQNSASMTMAVLTGVALLCYAVNLYRPVRS